ncbi:bifunctional metallophosphatase/5'-nucleotidase [Novosphingobium lentum]|uniref:bifunctional metallophosphatase/5'-nucleotidase n=1 Tax=Novosphingobium lentum TaxID=145287 RepID=UPI00082D18DC|nr:bifunctional metallophosphatase/5'-nucleotidase [Novosphingobium lentum]
MNLPLRFCPVARLAPLLALLASACAAPMASHPVAHVGTPVDNAPVEVGIVAINDFHGSLEPPHQSVQAPDGKGGVVQVPAGGAAWLASAIDGVRGQYPNHLTVSAGDLISASQLPSSLYLDEPAVGVANRFGLEFNAVGNHEFDRGRDELLRMQTGGCVKHTARQPCQLEPFAGAEFKFLSASTIDRDGKTLFPATGLKSFGTGARKVTVGVIGLTLKGTTELVSPEGIKGLTFADEAQTINAAVPVLKAAGADAIVVLIHQGGKTSGQPDPNGCNAMLGDIRPIIDQLDPRVDVIVSGHTHWAYICDYRTMDPARPFLLTSAGVYGELVTDIRLEIDTVRHAVVEKQAHNVIVQSLPYTSSRGPVANTALYPQFQPRADIAQYVQRYADAAKSFSQRVIGHVSGPASKGEGAAANSGGALGNLIADSQLGATRGAGAQIAFMNPFGIRASLVPTADGTVTFGDIYAIQPFGNQVVTETMTGAELKATLEQGFDNDGPEQVLTPSAGFAYRFDRSRPVGSRIVAMTFAGRPVRSEASYRVTMNGFLSQGGDGFTGFVGKPGAVTGATDIDALEGWIKAVPLRQVPDEDRAGPVGG